MKFLSFGTDVRPLDFKLPPLFKIGEAVAPPAASKPGSKLAASLDADVKKFNITTAGIGRKYLAAADAVLDQARARTADVTWLAGARQAARESVQATTDRVAKLKAQLASLPDSAPLDEKTSRLVALALRHSQKTLKSVDEISGSDYLAEFGRALITVLKWTKEAVKTTVTEVLDATVKPIADATSNILWPVAIGAVAVGGILLATKMSGPAKASP